MGHKAGSARKSGKREERVGRAAGHRLPANLLVPFSSSLAVEGSWARRASRVPTARAAWTASRARPALWASRASQECLASLGSPGSR